MAQEPLKINRRQPVEVEAPAAPTPTKEWKPGHRKFAAARSNKSPSMMLAVTAGIMAGLVLVIMLVVAVFTVTSKAAPPAAAPVPGAQPAPPKIEERVSSSAPVEPKKVTTVRVPATAPAVSSPVLSVPVDPVPPPPVFGAAPLQEPPPAAEAPTPAEPEEEVAKATRIPAKPVAKPAPAPKAEASRPSVKPGTVIDRIPVKTEKRGPVQCTVVELAQPKGKMMKVQESWQLCGSTKILGKTWQICEAGTRKLYALEGVQLKRNGLVATAITNLGSCK